MREERDSVKLYSKKDSNTTILLEKIDNKETIEDAYSAILFENMKAGNSVKPSDIIVNGIYKGYVLETTDNSNDSKIVNIYLFKTEDGVIRRITISSFVYDEEVFDVYNTFVLKRGTAS